MKKYRNSVSCEQAKSLDLVDYLHSLGHQAKRISGANYWYLSPLRTERTPSFKVDRKRNLWYDHGIGKGGTIIDFGVSYHTCSLSEFLHKLSAYFSFHQAPILKEGAHIVEDKNRTSADQNPVPPGSGTDRKTLYPNDTDKEGQTPIRIQQVGTLHSLVLERYLHRRNIPLSLAKIWLSEVQFSLREKQYLALGFLNASGGYELRHPYFKGSSSPKDVTYVERSRENLLVFEGFFDFLSLLSICPGQACLNSSFLVLNSLSFVPGSIPYLAPFEKVSLFLDHDTAGRKQTAYLLSQNARCRDESGLYQGYKDLNDWICSMGKKQRVGQKPRWS